MLSKKSVLKTFVVMLMVVLVLNVTFFLVINFIKAAISPIVICQFFLIIFICILELLLDTYKYSLNKTFWLFSLFFFGVAPLLQYCTQFNLWNYKLTNEDYFVTNNFIFLSFGIYIAILRLLTLNKSGKFYLTNFDDNKEEGKIFELEHNTILYKLKFLLPIFSLVAMLVLIYFIGFKNMFYRDTNYIESIDDSLLSTLIMLICRVMPVYCFLLTSSIKRKNNIDYVILAFELCCIIICNFPTSVTRFWMGAIYLGLMLIILRKFKYRRWYDLSFIIIFLIIFPLFAQFKKIGLNDSNVSIIFSMDIFITFNNVDFDAYSILARTIIYVNKYGDVGGSQILGTLLFWIPRSIWPSKPLASGAFIAIQQDQKYTNISCPIIAEGYLNFGYIGVIVFIALFAIIVFKYDLYFWKSKNKNSLLKIIYPFMLGFTIFLLRGAIHHAIVYIFIFSVPVIGLAIFKKVFFKKIEVN